MNYLAAMSKNLSKFHNNILTSLSLFQNFSALTPLRMSLQIIQCSVSHVTIFIVHCLPVIFFSFFRRLVEEIGQALIWLLIRGLSMVRT